MNGECEYCERPELYHEDNLEYYKTFPDSFDWLIRVKRTGNFILRSNIHNGIYETECPICHRSLTPTTE